MTSTLFQNARERAVRHWLGQRTLGLSLAQHLPGLGVLLVVTLWLMRRFLFTDALPAGTDFLGFVSRARHNASWGEVTSLWAPSGWGAIRQFTADNLLGLLTIATGSPVWTVKLLAAATLVSAGGFAYLLAWRWYHSRLTATVAGLVYLTSQASVSRWASGQLNVEIAFAAAPLLILLWIECVERFSVRRAVVFALAASAVMLVRLDMVLYVVPFLMLHAVVHVALDRRPWRAVGSLAASAAVVVPAALALGLYQIVPILAGVRASWLSTGGLFEAKEFLERSLEPYPSLLALGREIGYLGFSGQQTWFFHPWVPLWAYYAAASVLPAVAFVALRMHRDRRSIFLAAAAVLGVFLGKGMRPPFGEPYRWAIENVPIFGNLREPNRWLIVATLAYGVLAGLTVSAAWRWSVAHDRRWHFAAGALVVAALTLLPTAPTLASGLQAWRPSDAQLALLDVVERDRGSFRVATVPFDQTMRFLEQHDYRGFEHDLGAESAAFTGHPTLGDGGWHQRASDTVAYLARLLERRDPAFTKLLANLGVKYVIEFDYPATAPHLRTGLSRAALRDPAAGTGFQQRALATMPGLVLAARTDAGSVYRLQDWAQPLTFRPNLAVVLGGRSGLPVLASAEGVRLRDWAAVTAEDAIESGGLAALLRLIGRSDLLVISNERLLDVAVLATPPVIRLPGLSSDEGLDRLTQLLPSDESVRSGSLADQTVAPAGDGETVVAATFVAPAPAKEVELWLRMRTGSRQAGIHVEVDGEPIRTLTPLAPVGGGFRWFRAFGRTFAPGSEHTLALSALPSVYGDRFELDEARLVVATARKVALDQIARAVAEKRSRILYALDLDEAGKWAATTIPTAGQEPVAVDPATFWSVLETRRVRGSTSAGPGSTPALGLELRRGRRIYTLVRHRFARPLNWSGRTHVFLTVRGTGSGRTYTFIADFDAKNRRSARYTFVDDRPGWRTIAFSTREPDAGRPRWETVHGVRLAIDRRDVDGELLLGQLALSRLDPLFSFRYPLVAVDRPREVTVGENIVATVASGSDSLTVRVPLDLVAGARLIVTPQRPIQARPALPLPSVRAGVTRYDVDFVAPVPGTLVFTEGFDPEWRMRASTGTDYAPISVFSLANGYILDSGTRAESVGFRGDKPARLGLALSGVSLLALLGIAFGLPLPRLVRR